MMASAQCLVSTQTWLYGTKHSVAREKANTAIYAIENWLTTQSQKHTSTVDLQIRVLVLFAKQTTLRKFKRAWTEIGGLLHLCMAAGLHGTPDLIRKPVSLLDREPRRRVWAAVTEMELQVSFDQGMISAPWDL
jgi:hypothetical protein